MDIFSNRVAAPNSLSVVPWVWGIPGIWLVQLGHRRLQRVEEPADKKKWGSVFSILWVLKILPRPSFEKVWKLQATAPTDSAPPKALALYDFILICRHLLLCKAVLTKVHYQDC